MVTAFSFCGKQRNGRLSNYDNDNNNDNNNDTVMSLKGIHKPYKGLLWVLLLVRKRLLTFYLRIYVKLKLVTTDKIYIN